MSGSNFWDVYKTTYARIICWEVRTLCCPPALSPSGVLPVLCFLFHDPVRSSQIPSSLIPTKENKARRLPHQQWQSQSLKSSVSCQLQAAAFLHTAAPYWREKYQWQVPSAELNAKCPILGPHLGLALTTSSSGQLQLAMLCYKTFPFLLPMHMCDVMERERWGFMVILWAPSYN